MFKAGLDTPSLRDCDKRRQPCWVAISGVLLGSPEADKFEPPHVKIFDKDGKLLREVGKGTFSDGDERDWLLCRERQDLRSPNTAKRFGEMDNVNAQPKLIIKDLFNGDHRNGGITCKDGYIYFALGFPSNSGFADPDNHGWTDIPNDPFWVKHQDGHGTPPRTTRCAATSSIRD